MRTHTQSGWIKTLTASGSRAHGAVAGALGVAADVADAGVEQALVAEIFAVHVLDAPEAAGGDCALLRAFGDVHSGEGLLGCEAQGGGCEGSGQLLEDRGHYRGADEKRERKVDDEAKWGDWAQVGRWGKDVLGVGVGGIYQEYVVDDDLNIAPTSDCLTNAMAALPGLSFAIFESPSSSKGLPPHLAAGARSRGVGPSLPHGFEYDVMVCVCVRWESRVRVAFL